MLGTVSGYAKVLASGHGALIVWGSLGLAIAVVFGRWMTTKGHGLGDPLGSVNFSFADSWATTFTGVGALLGTILGTTGIIADNATPLSSNAFTGLNLLFALIAAFAPLVFSAFQTASPNPGPDGPGYQGYVVTFLAACTLTVWAAVGEIVTIILLLRGVQDGFLTGSMTWLFLAMLCVSVVAIVVYAWVRVPATLEFKRTTMARDADARLPRWSLL